MKMPKVYVLNGPNLNLLGTREPQIYGTGSLKDLDQLLQEHGKRLGFEIVFRQTNHEGHLVDWIHEAGQKQGFVIINGGAYSHTSIAIRDAISGSGVVAVEVHLSNVHARESFRHVSMLAPVCMGSICGFHFGSYVLALEALRVEIMKRIETPKVKN